MSEPEYEITKDDVEKMLRWLRLNLPDQATPEKAIFLLEQRKIHLEKLEELHPDIIEQMLLDFEEH
ncbi:MAG TPA: hypothetical protein VMR34_02895 [Candidatus Saccharimonadales bacterium]|nr:hypothetical protein [Candidatus Saccharimonadales bacterium]